MTVGQHFKHHKDHQNVRGQDRPAPPPPGSASTSANSPRQAAYSSSKSNNRRQRPGGGAGGGSPNASQSLQSQNSSKSFTIAGESKSSLNSSCHSSVTTLDEAQGGTRRGSFTDGRTRRTTMSGRSDGSYSENFGFHSDDYGNRSLTTAEEIQLSEKNRHIVVTNIRHYNVLFWILLFANGATVISYGALFHRLSTSDSKFYSVKTVSPYILPSITVTICVTCIHWTSAFLRLFKMDFKAAIRLYTFMSALHLVHLLIMFPANGIKMHYSLANLEKDMMKDLRSSSIQRVKPSLNFTQFERHCCGVKNLNDWYHDEMSSDNFNKSDPEFAPTYPESCCPPVREESDEEYQIDDVCLPERAWETGCHEREYFWAAWYAGWYLGLVGLQTLLFVGLFLQMERLLTYTRLYKEFASKKEALIEIAPPPPEESAGAVDIGVSTECKASDGTCKV